MAGGSRKKAESAFVAAIVTGGTVADAAKTARIGERTAYAWLKRGDVRSEITEARGRMVSQACGRLSDACTAAADTLRALLLAESETVRLGAARSLLEMTVSLRREVDFAERVAAIEAYITTTQEGPSCPASTGD
ncbi:MAG: IS630 transposase-related protein [Planctomycetota bacterium]|nr:IS630 transposase-related protein [Planctomycetota bacterium]